MTIKTTGIHNLKANLSAYLRKVQAGGKIVVAQRQQEGVLAPDYEEEAATVRNRMLALRDAGLLIWDGGDFALPHLEPANKLREDVLASDLVSEGRD